MTKTGNKHTNQREPKGKTLSPVSGIFSSPVNRTTHIAIMAGIALLTFFVLKPCLDNLLTNWDDPGYIQDNATIKHLTIEGLKAIFSTPVMGNYHPLTILSYAIEYSFVQFEPWLYHFDNLILHTVDTLLVYWLVWLLTRKPIAGIITALLFGLHPMHVESVAWVSGRKDVLYALFYFTACILYVYRLRAAEGTTKSKLYIGILAAFVCSILAKPVATTLPITLLLIDYFEKRPMNIRLLTEKIPHFIIALIFGIVAIKVQQSAGAMDMHKEHYTFFERIALGGYSFITYIWKAILPVHLCNFYAYPAKTAGSLSSLYYFYPAAAAILLALAWKFLRKNSVLVFGLLFFIANIALLLQFYPVGDAIFAERYSYIPYTGLFFIAGWYMSGYFDGSGKPYSGLITGGFSLYMLTLFFISNGRTGVWHDPITLWTDAIEKDPVHDIGAYNNLGFIYYQKWAVEQDPAEKQKYYDSGLYLLKTGISLNPEFPNPYISLGEMLRGSGRYDEAKEVYLQGLRYDKKNANMHLGLAILYFVTHDTANAARWFRAAINVDPSPQAYGNYGNFLNLTGHTDSALILYSLAIKRAPGMYNFYLNRGRLLRDHDRADEALADFNEALKINPDLGESYYERSLCYHKKGDFVHALLDADKAISLGYPKVDNIYYEELKRHH